MYIFSQNGRFLHKLETCELYGTPVTGATVYVNGTVFGEYPNYEDGQRIVADVADRLVHGGILYYMPEAKQ